MRSRRGLLSRASLILIAAGAVTIASAAGPAGSPAAALSGPPRPSPKAWTADNGNGTYSNPLFFEEFEDPDVIRVGEDYYLAGTTMHMMPAVMLMHSKDLVNWELAGYCQDKLDLGPNYRLENGRGIYGGGIWAPCIRYHNGMFYVFCNVNGAGLMVYRAKDIKGPWERNELPGKHDMSVLFDDDLNKVFLIYGNGSPYNIDELAPDLKSVARPGAHKLTVPQGSRFGEGHHLYKIKGKYYDLSAIPGGAVNQMVARADSIDGPWTITTMVDGESLGISANPARTNAGDRGVWLHQGGMVDTPNGDWWCTIMSDHGSAGRMVSLVPITWDNDFPLIGLPGNLRKAPNTWIKPNTGVQQEPSPAFPHDDNFDGPKLNNTWQWNHVEDDTKWSLTEKKGVLRLHSLPAANLYAARDTLCMKPPAPESTMTVELDGSGMKEGDNAGLGAIDNPYFWIGLVKTAAGLELQAGQAGVGGGGGRGRGGAGAGAGAPVIKGPDNPPAHLWLRLHCNFDTDQGQFSWSSDGKTFTQLSSINIPGFQLQTFQGLRPGLYHFNTSGQAGGYADFDNFVCDSPRAAGIERDIPMGKTVELTSGADGSALAADVQNNTLINLPAAQGGSPNARFQVIDLGLGRVELKAANGKVVSASETGVVLKDLAGAKPGDAETFQWVNLMRGDTMLMSLTNHKYLATRPNAPGAVTATALGATPARKSGAEFKWKVVD